MFYILNKDACLFLALATLLLGEGMAWKHVLRDLRSSGHPEVLNNISSSSNRAQRQL